MSLFHVLCAFLYFWPSTRIMCCFYNQEETWWWLKIRLFYFSAVLGLPCCAWASRCNGFCCRAQALGHAGSRHAGAAVLVQGLSCSVARGIFPDQGSNWCPLQCKAHLKPLDHKGSPGKHGQPAEKHKSQITEAVFLLSVFSLISFPFVGFSPAPDLRR